MLPLLARRTVAQDRPASNPPEAAWRAGRLAKPACRRYRGFPEPESNDPHGSGKYDPPLGVIGDPEVLSADPLNAAWTITLGLAPRVREAWVLSVEYVSQEFKHFALYLRGMSLSVSIHYSGEVSHCATAGWKTHIGTEHES
jgi:hypothetical protein